MASRLAPIVCVQVMVGGRAQVSDGGRDRVGRERELSGQASPVVPVVGCRVQGTRIFSSTASTRLGPCEYGTEFGDAAAQLAD